MSKEGIFTVPNETVCDDNKKSRPQKFSCRDGAGAGAGAGAEAVIRIYGSTEPEPKEILTAKHHCCDVYMYILFVSL